MQPGAFETTDGRPVSAVSATEMREIDRVAVEEVGVDLLMMMENAGRNLATHVVARPAGRVTVLAGSGGNGGGGLACARHLANHRVPVEVVLDRPSDELDGAAARQRRILEATGVAVGVGPEGLDPGALVVDALVGYGLDGPLRGTAAALVDALNETAQAVVSLDVPSGLDATTGEAGAAVVEPEAVVTLALPKVGLRDVGCEVFLADIGIPDVVFERVGVEYVPPFRGDYVVQIVPG